MLRVGLTGGIGSGKSTVAQRLVANGAVLVDADRIARAVVAPGTVGYDAVVAEFGPGVVAPDGSLDRARLGRIVFQDEPRRQALNAIVHPLVAERRSQLVDRAPADAVVVEDIPLLVENGLGVGFPLVVVVHAPAEERVRRLVAERGMDADDAWARVRSQAGDAARRAAADVWLDNAGPRGAVLAQVDAVWEQRMVPFEANLRTGRPAERVPRAVVVPPDPEWPVTAARLLGRVRAVAGGRAHRSDHIGSTAVPGLPAKDVIDLQVVVDDVATAGEVADDLAAVGLLRRPGRWWDDDRDGGTSDKAMAQNADPGRSVNCHVRPADSPAWRDALLLRDYLRDTPGAAGDYARLKRELAAAPHDSIDDYAGGKTPWMRFTLATADAWADRTGWTTAPT
ncbi:MAG TPA: dephospho-CoA kinase [Jiangellaceae bacterium]|nr:dephospho-CoA kinase [Jiangellaceae bacterium]